MSLLKNGCVQSVMLKLRYKSFLAILLLSCCLGGSALAETVLNNNHRIIGHCDSLSPKAVFNYLGTFKATAYCSCPKCCGKSDGITASGKRAHNGTIACNWLPFGTKLIIAPRGCNSQEMAFKHYPIGTVLDRGAKSQFGSKHNHIKHIDLWMSNHAEALKYGVHQVNVWVVEARGV